MIKKMLKQVANRYGYDIVRSAGNGSLYPPDFSAEEIALIQTVRPFTMTSPERIVSLSNAVKYIVNNRIPGDIIECGVWRGGSAMVILHTLLALGDLDRNIYLFDTYQGMTPPSDEDVIFSGETAAELLDSTEKKPADNLWCWATLEDVRQNILSMGYPEHKIHFVEGDVLETIPATMPEQIALLRLDTDWYASTKHELEHLFPRLTRNGILLIDDYGHWQGARAAVDEYFAGQAHKPLLQRIDYTGRCVVKTY